MVDRPLECSDCRRAIAFTYTEVTTEGMTRVHMCEECPVLSRRLHGIATTASAGKEGSPSLRCQECGTSFEALLTGAPIGCAHCYEVFDSQIAKELNAVIPPAILGKGSPRPQGQYHVGRRPGQLTDINPSLRLIALNKALEEMLAKEDYEQAAWLRDQIKSLEGERHDH